MALNSIKRVLLPLVILGAGVAGFSLLVATKPQSEAAPRQESVWTVAVRPVELSRLRPSLTLYGRVETPRHSRLKAAVEASVDRVTVKEGERVVAGQPLVTLDDRETGAVLAQREADARDAEAAVTSEQSRHENDLRALEREQELLALARSELNRAEDLLRQGLGSESQRDAAQQNLVRQRLAVESRQQAIADHVNRQAQVEARLKRALAQQEIARLNHQRTRISAPFIGRITRVAVAPGDRVRPGDTVAEVYDIDALEVRAQIPDPHLGVIRQALDDGTDLPATSRVDGRTIRLWLDRLAGEVQEGSGGVGALFRLDETAEWLTIGRFVTLRLTLPPRPDVAALPREAIYGRDRIYRIVDGRLAPVTVERVGSRITTAGGEEVLVSSPELHSGDQVVTTQLPNAVEGLRVRTATSAAFEQ